MPFAPLYCRVPNSRGFRPLHIVLWKETLRKHPRLRLSLKCPIREAAGFAHLEHVASLPEQNRQIHHLTKGRNLEGSYNVGTAHGPSQCRTFSWTNFC